MLQHRPAEAISYGFFADNRHKPVTDVCAHTGSKSE